MKWVLRIPVLLLCLCFAVGCGGGGASGTDSPNPSRDGRIAFTTYPSGFGYDGYGHISTMEPDGSGRTDLTSGISVSSPKFSWDGAMIAFSVYDFNSGNTRIYLMNSDGSGMHRLEGVTAYAPKQTDPAFSPDSNRIAFRYGTDSNSASFEIGIIQSDGTGFKVLTHNSVRDSRPCFSPDGNVLAFQRSVTGGSDIYAIGTDGSGEHLLVSNGAFPVFSPDGTKLMFVRSGDIYLANANGTNQIRIVSGKGVQGIAFSPDGRYIVYESDPSGQGPSYICVAGLDGANTIQLLEGGEPSWGPK